LEQPPWLQEADCGHTLDDEWFYASIQRYDHLYMYSLSCNVACMALDDKGHHLALVGRSRRGGQSEAGHELMVFSLPDKLLMANCPAKEGLAGKRDFSLRAGYRGQHDNPTLAGCVQVCFGQNADEVLTLTCNKLTSWTRVEQADLYRADRQWDVSLGPARMHFHLGFVYVANGRNLTVINSQNGDSTVTEWPSPLADFKVDQHGDIIGVNANGRRITAEDQNKERQTETLKNVALCKEDDRLTALVRGQSLVINCLNEPVCELQNEDLLDVSNMWWWTKESLVAACRSVLNVYNFKGNSLSLAFRHDGHAGRVTAWSNHPNVARLSFSVDDEGALHAWQFNAGSLISDL